MHIKGRIKFSQFSQCTLKEGSNLARVKTGRNRAGHIISFTKLEFICKDLIYATPLRLPYIIALWVSNLRLDNIGERIMRGAT